MLQLSAPAGLAKASPSERQRLEGVLGRQEGRIRRAFTTFLAEGRSDRTLRELRELLQDNKTTEAIGIVDQHVVALGRVIPQAIADVAGLETVAVGSRLSRLSRVAISFDPSQPRVAQIMRASAAQFVQEVTTSQRAAIRAALATSAAKGEGVAASARAIRDVIGLTQSQAESVENYRQLLEAGSKGALDRALRDRRFDRTVERAADEGEPLTGPQIARMVERYRMGVLDHRAQTIAQTEALGAVSLARHEATQQIIEQTGIDPALVQRTWHATRDKRVRDSHAEMDGQTVGLDESFTSGLGNELMYPGDPAAPPEDRIRCRCVVTIETLTS